MDEQRARELVARERQRVEATLNDLTGAVADEGPLDAQQRGEMEEGGELATEMTDIALEADLRGRLAAVERAEARIAAGTYGRSIESGAVIPDERLEADPLAERTVDEQRRFDQIRQ
jgi:DnaK suppressor protein